MPKLLGMFGIGLLLTGLACAQEPVPQDGPLTTLKIGTRVVSVSAVVRDAHGEPVKGLTRDDFVLKQDGRDQEIRYFSEDADLPLTLALMVDTSSSQKAFIEDETEASERFFRQMLTRPVDRAVLVQFDWTVLQLQAMTPNVKALENALRYLSMPHPAGEPMPKGGGGTMLYDAIVAASKFVLNQERGRRAMVILTDGEDNGSRFNVDQAIAAAQQADIVVYSVEYSMKEGTNGFPRGPVTGGFDRGKGVLQAISAATGGRVFTVSPAMPLDRIYLQIAEDMRLQYQLGFVPVEGKPGVYHKLELKTKAKHVTVEARQGYYSPK